MLELWPPALIFLLGAVVLMRAGRGLGGALMLALPLLAFTQLLTVQPGDQLTVDFYGLDLVPFAVDQLSLAFGYVFVLATFIAGVYGLQLMTVEERAAATLYAGSALGVVFAGDLITLFFFWEIKALASVFLIWSRRTPASGPAGKRYLYVQLFGGKLLLAGVIWHYALTGSLVFTAFALTPATGLILIGFLVAAAVPPLHPWLPDGYPQGTIAGTVFLSAFTTKAAVYALARGFPGTEALVWLGVAMALYGVVYAVLENDIRRLLAYHIISQVGYMVAAVGIGTELALNGATAHAFAHILYKGALLMGAGAVLYAVGESRASELGGLWRKMRWVLLLYMIGAVSISSFPLFSGFISKELVVAGASADGRLVVLILLKIASVGTFLHTGLKLPYNTFFGPDRGLEPRPVLPTMYLGMLLAAVANTTLGLAPGLLYDVLPFPVDYEPYAFAKVVETVQILVFTALGFWLLRAKLGADRTVSLDTDWFYRVAPFRLAAWVRGLRPPRARQESEGLAHHPPRREQIASAVAETYGQLPFVREAAAASRSPVYPTWMVGGVVIAAAALLLGVTLL